MRAIGRGLLGAIALTVTSAGLGAQAFSPTGVNVLGGIDQSWTVTCSTIGSLGQPACPTTSATGASKVTASPAGWLPVPSTDGAFYISASPSGTLWSGAPGEDPAYQYVFKTTFDVANASTSMIGFNVFGFDNYLVSGTINGNPFTVTPTPLGPNGGNWMTPFTLTGGTGLTNTGNQLELVITGNGRTDGMMVSGYTQSTVPEPSSMALLGTGLMGLIPLVRRKRS